jgi:hypothetical protein
MGKRSAKYSKAQRVPGQYTAVPWIVLDSQAYVGLSASAKALLIDIARQYNGRNNGDLSVTLKLMKGRGWKSSDTLNRAKRELIDSGLLFETRKGGFPNKCSLYGITWWKLDPSQKYDIDQRAFPYGQWKGNEVKLVPLRPAIMMAA